MRLWILFVLGSVSIIAVAGLVIPVNRYVRSRGYVTTELYAEVRPGTVGTVAEILAFELRVICKEGQAIGASRAQGQISGALDIV